LDDISYNHRDSNNENELVQQLSSPEQSNPNFYSPKDKESYHSSDGRYDHYSHKVTPKSNKNETFLEHAVKVSLQNSRSNYKHKIDFNKMVDEGILNPIHDPVELENKIDIHHSLPNNQFDSPVKKKLKAQNYKDSSHINESPYSNNDDEINDRIISNNSPSLIYQSRMRPPSETKAHRYAETNLTDSKFQNSNFSYEESKIEDSGQKRESTTERIK